MLDARRRLALLIGLLLLAAGIALMPFFTATEPGFCLGCYGTHLALYRGDVLRHVYNDSNIALLSDYDRYLLRGRIPVHTKEELSRLLEDFDCRAD